MKTPSNGVHQAHPGREQDREAHDGVPRQRLGGEQSRRGEQCDLGGGVEAHAEDHADGVHLPFLGDRLHPRAEHPVHEAPVLQLLLELLLVVVAVAHLAEHRDDASQDHDVEEGDEVEESGRDDGAEDPAELLEPRSVVRDRPIHRLLGDDDARPDGDHDGRVAEREEVADAERLLSLVHQLAGGVVDRRDVVGVEGVAQPERVGQHRHADAQALVVAGDDEDDEDPEPDDVEQQDGGEHQLRLEPLGRGHVPPELPELLDRARLGGNAAVATMAGTPPLRVGKLRTKWDDKANANGSQLLRIRY